MRTTWVWAATLTVALAQASLARAEEKKAAGPTTRPAEAKMESGSAGLGIRMSPVPPAVAAHLGLKDAGIMILNVVKGGPTDVAGLDRYDIILAVDGKNVPSDMEKFGQDIRARLPGQKVRLKVIQKGQTKEVEVTLGFAASGAGVTFKHENEDEPVLRDQMFWRGNVLRLGPGGQIEGGAGAPLPEDVRQFLKIFPGQGAGGVVVEVQEGGGDNTFKVAQVRDGKKIEIEQKKDGEITVRRSDEPAQGDKKVLTRSFKSVQELQKADPQAYELYKNAHQPTINLRVIDVPEGQTPEQLQKEIQQKVQEMLKSVEANRKEMESGMPPRLHQPGADNPHPAAEREFKVQQDGQIEVHIRKGADDLTVQFKNEQEMKVKQPELFQQYQKMLKE